MRRAGDVVPKGEILDGVWDFAFEGDPNIVEVYIGHLRAKIDRPVRPREHPNDPRRRVPDRRGR
jgi:DNA-binding response OmpR family regulator